MSDINQLNSVFKDVHWLMDILQNIDVGLIVMDTEFHIQLWNSFMQNHSSLRPVEVQGKSLFEVFPELSENWFRHKARSVLVLQNVAFTTWEQRPYLFRFPHYRPITGTASHMYQNSTILPLINPQGVVEHLCLIIYDVTDTAVNKLELQDANRQLQEMSRTDHLTGLYNRGYWETCLAREFRRFERYGLPATLILFDIDHFKSVNDTYGHTVGDDVIREVSRALQAEVRDIDIPGRYGGEEFGVILTGTAAQGGRTFAERLRKNIEKMTVQSEGMAIDFTISLGVAEISETLDNHRAWIEKADQALYTSKESGRNCTSIAP